MVKPKVSPFDKDELNSSTAMMQAIDALDTAATIAQRVEDVDTLIKVAHAYIEISTYLGPPSGTEGSSKTEKSTTEGAEFRTGFSPKEQ